LLLMRPCSLLLPLACCLLLLGTSVPAQAAPKTLGGSEVVDFSIEPKESSRLFGAAVKNWNAAFQPKKIRATLKALAKGQLAMSPELKQELYVVRKSSAIVRATFQLLDEGHQKPKSLDRYVRAAGKLNDAINSGQHKKIPALAKKTLQAMQVEAIRAEVKGFVPTSAESFQGYLYTSMLFAEKASSAKKLKAPVYHQLRKEMTNLLVLFEPGRKMSPGVQRLHDRLHHIRLSMGDVHDTLVAKKSKDPTSYTAKKVKLTKMNRKDVRQVLRSIRIQKPAVKTLHYDRWRANIKPGRGSSKAAPKKVR
jgi:hypothetical protein